MPTTPEVKHKEHHLLYCYTITLLTFQTDNVHGCKHGRRDYFWPLCAYLHLLFPVCCTFRNDFKLWQSLKGGKHMILRTLDRCQPHSAVRHEIFVHSFDTSNCYYWATHSHLSALSKRTFANKYTGDGFVASSNSWEGACEVWKHILNQRG